MIILDRKFKINPDVVYNESDDSTILLFNDKLYMLNEVAGWLWSHIDDTYFGELVDQLINIIEDEIDSEVVHNDCKSIILAWIDAGLVMQIE